MSYGRKDITMCALNPKSCALHTKTRLKYTAIFVCMTVIPLFFVGFLSYKKAANTLEDEALNRLSAIAASKKIEIINFFNEKKSRVNDFAENESIRGQLERISMSNDQKETAAATVELNEYLKSNKWAFDKTTEILRVYDAKGNIVGSIEKNDLQGDITRDAKQPFFVKAMKGVPYAQNISSYQGKAMINIGAPIRNRAGDQVIGVLMSGFRLKSITDVLLSEQKLQLGVNPSTRVADLSHGIYLINPGKRILAGTGKISRKDTLDNDAALKCVGTGQEILKDSIDPNGKEVLVASLCPQIEKDWRWILLVEESKEDSLSPLNSFWKILFAGSSFAIAMAFLVAWVVAHFMPHHRHHNFHLAKGRAQ